MLYVAYTAASSADSAFRHSIKGEQLGAHGSRSRISSRRPFAPEHEDFQPRTMWSLSNAFTSAFKDLDPIPQFKAPGEGGSYLERVLGS
jgi:hypothetical protein